jgi:hypothetical protein
VKILFKYDFRVIGAKRRTVPLVLSVLLITLFTVIPTTVSASNPCPDTNAFNGISSLTLWLRADCVGGNATDPADNTVLTTWNDLSGNGNNATANGSPTYQSDAANLINSQPVINFNGGSTFSSIDIRAVTRPNITIFSVYKLRNSNQQGVWGVDNGGWDRFFMARWNGDNGIISHSGTTAVPNSGVGNTTKLVTTIYKYNVGSGSSVYDNGNFVSSFTDTADPNGAYTRLTIGSIGAGYNMNGDVAEIVIFSQALSSSDLKIVNGYLNTKYNLGMSASNVPDNLVFNSLTIGANPTYRLAVTITANVSAASKVSFKVQNKFIPGCRNVLSAATSPFVATCSWRPSVRGPAVITASAVPTVSGASTANAAPLTTTVKSRATLR